MGKKYSHLTYDDRIRIECLRKAKVPVKSIAKQLGVHFTTIYRELKRGTYIHLNYDYTETVRYSPDKAWERYRFNLSAKGRELKIGNDRVYSEYLEHMICDEGYAPGAVLGEIKNKKIEFKTAISKTTFYRYIDLGVFLRLSNKNLPYKKAKKQKKKNEEKRRKRAQPGDSIEKRPLSVLKREDFGCWEGDCIEGKKGTRKTIFTLVERKTRFSFIFLMPSKTAESVVNVFDKLEKKIGTDLFRKVFRSITFDNGSEFYDCNGVETSCLMEGARTKVYYCHPYCPSERGSNENLNRLVRRKFPKGTDFTNVSAYDVKKVQSWVRNYPREMFDYRTSAELFQECMERLVSEN